MRCGKHVLIVGVRRQVVAQQVVEPRIETAFRYLARILKLEGAGGGVSRIGKKRFLVVCSFFVKFLEHFPGHQYLSPDLELFGPVARKKLQRYAADGLDVGSHVVALCAVAASHGSDETSSAVGERDRGAVEFHLADYAVFLSF